MSGIVGRIWTLRRDYPELRDPEEFRAWSTPGTARVVFANWIEGDALVLRDRGSMRSACRGGWACAPCARWFAPSRV